MTIEDGQRPSASNLEATPPIPVVDTKEQLIPPEDFIRNLYKETFKWLTEERGAVVVASFNQDNILEWGHRIKRNLVSDNVKGVSDNDDLVLAEIKDWDNVEGRHGHPMGLPIELEEAALLKDENNQYALVLGTRHHRYSDSGLGFQAGYIPDNGDHSRVDTYRLHAILNPYANNATVDFSILRMGPLRINIDAWANSFRNGGREISDDHDDPLRTTKGFEDSMVLVKDTLTRGHRSSTLK